MFGIDLLTGLICLVVFYARTSNGQCWSNSACIDAGQCSAKGGSSTAGLCPGASNMRCCTCNNCMDATACSASGGTSYAGICPGAANIKCCVKSDGPSEAGSYKPVNTMLTDLADILRAAGLTVVEEADWKTRGHRVMSSVKGILVHHTAGPATGEFPSKNIVKVGRSDLAGPLAQLGLGRSGTWYVIAAGLSYHAGKTIDDSIFGNANAIGIEAEATGTPVDAVGHKYWPEVQWQSYVRGVKALKQAYGIPTARVLGHKEAAMPLGRKPDPNFSMEEFRAALG
ncbi:unnamed protein product [Rotaria magnacalcarata]|uniref:N-acetylmuramoyl-L-alanine amidase domain-containing protein n=1 Tax=Rotaria magnacalcarata TaxID=392030 RepID=A0A815V4K9_9BILA|nr:unnamed protein product [Rotaria magnacalcarata]CAF1524584.1 unnamed protein product [Rotaria magnacalcarata]CAF4100050.1 unnamed protein product [Rotaria magnacalcarata]CAF4113395.1 unnamed protein product [Rotaria magnacalcarata]